MSAASPIDRLEARLGHRFARRALLEEALTHSSAGEGRRDRPANYERLEFLGDRVLGLAVAEMLIERHPDEAEGALGRRFAAAVQRDALAEVAQALGIGPALAIAAGDEGKRENPTILADACEAVIGAIHLDAGFDVARAVVRSHWAAMLDREARPPRDPKSTLQEWALGRSLPLPRYVVTDRSGPDHQPVFTIRLEVDGAAPVTATGPSKREAERAAAAAFLEREAGRPGGVRAGRRRP